MQFFRTLQKGPCGARVALLTLSAAFTALAQDSAVTRERIQVVADAVIRNATFAFLDVKSGKRFASPSEAPATADLRPESGYHDWRYWNGVLHLGMLRAGEILHDTVYESFVRENIAFAFRYAPFFAERYHGQDKWEYPFGQWIVMEELDDYGAMGASLVKAYCLDPRKPYRDYLARAATYLLARQHRLEDGTLVRAFPVRWTLWADDLYMSVSLLSRMGEWTRERRYFDDAARQVINFHRFLFNIEKGLMHHCWYSDTDRPWVAIWGRANGWALMAQVDLLDRMPADHPERDTLLALLRRHIAGVVRCQSPSGLWHQLLDKEDSYLETSCSAMFTYTIARAVKGGYIAPRYASVARRGWEGVMANIHPDGQVEGVCTGTGVGDDLEFYYTRPTPLNDAHGVGAVLLAGTAR